MAQAVNRRPRIKEIRFRSQVTLWQVLRFYPINNMLFLPSEKRSKKTERFWVSDSIGQKCGSKWFFSASPWYSIYFPAHMAAGPSGGVQGNWRSSSWYCVLLWCGGVCVWMWHERAIYQTESWFLSSLFIPGPTKTSLFWQYQVRKWQTFGTNA